MNELEPLFDRWANFYLLTAGASAALIGLLFVVITLASERREAESGVDDTAKIRIYLTPTVVFFASVILVAALLTFPNHTRLTAALCICLVGVVGLAYSASILIGGDKKSHEDWHDLITYTIVPFCGILPPRIGRSPVAPQPPARPHLYSGRHVVVAYAWHSQLVGHRHRRRYDPSWPTLKVDQENELTKCL